MFNCDYYYDCVCRFPHSAVPAGAASSSSSSSGGGDELEAIARSVEALILKSEKEITQSWAKALYKKHKKCRDPRFDPNSDQFVKVRLQFNRQRLSTAMCQGGGGLSLSLSLIRFLVAALLTHTHTHTLALFIQQETDEMEVALQPVERTAESAERSLLGMHSMDMDDDAEDGSGFLIRRSKRLRRDDGDVSMSSIDVSFDDRHREESKRTVL